MRHMKTVTIRELHTRTGELVREAAHHGEIRVTDRGRTVAKIVPEREPGEVPYFARRKMSPAFRRLDESGKTGLGTDSTVAISEDREDRV
jgi:prevent-host-death family protein